jgi:hypothetical protein
MDIDYIYQTSRKITQIFIDAKVSSICLYSAILLKEALCMNGIQSSLVCGFMKTTRGQGEFFQHVWLNVQGHDFDPSLGVLHRISWAGQNVGYSYHLEPEFPRTDSSADDLQVAVATYALSPMDFWNGFDNSTDPRHSAISQVINQIRDKLFLM